LKGLEDEPYYGFFAPAGTPKEALERFSSALARAITQPAVRDRLTAMGLTVEFMTGAQLAARESAYRKVWADIIARSGFKPQ
jgi:Uncharacterized protein conserved in bacteria